MVPRHFKFECSPWQPHFVVRADRAFVERRRTYGSHFSVFGRCGGVFGAAGSHFVVARDEAPAARSPDVAGVYHLVNDSVSTRRRLGGAKLIL